MVSAELKPDQPHCRSLTEAHDFMREPQPGYVYMYVQSPTGSQRWDMCYSVKSVTGREPQTEASGGCVPGNRPGRFSQMVRLHLQEERSRFAGGSAKNMSGKRVDGDETAHRTGLNDHAGIAKFQLLPTQHSLPFSITALRATVPSATTRSRLQPSCLPGTCNFHSGVQRPSRPRTRAGGRHESSGPATPTAGLTTSIRAGDSSIGTKPLSGPRG